MDLPTYLTFTGMGSKLIRLISGNENDIKELAKLLIEEFTGKQVPRLFSVKFAENPKEITAEGALASLNPQLHRIYPQLEKIYGFEGAARNYEFQHTPGLMQNVLNSYALFLDKLTSSQTIRSFVYNNYDVQFTKGLVTGLMDYAEQSYTMMSNRQMPAEAPVNETLFFWPLKHTLYMLSKTL